MRPPARALACPTPTASSARIVSDRVRRAGRTSDEQSSRPASPPETTPSGRLSSLVASTSRSQPSSSQRVSPPTTATFVAVSRSGTSGPSASVQLASPAATAAWSSPGRKGRSDEVDQRGACRSARPASSWSTASSRKPRPAPPCSSATVAPVQPSSASWAQLGSGVRGEERPRLRAQLVLQRREGEIHQRDLGSPSTRSATMFRRISDVPASIVLPRLRSCWTGQ